MNINFIFVVFLAHTNDSASLLRFVQLRAVSRCCIVPICQRFTMLRLLWFMCRDCARLTAINKACKLGGKPPYARSASLTGSLLEQIQWISPVAETDKRAIPSVQCFFCCFYTSEVCSLRIWMMPLCHPWAIPPICKLRPPLRKILLSSISQSLCMISKLFWCLSPCFEGSRIRLSHFSKDSTFFWLNRHIEKVSAKNLVFSHISISVHCIIIIVESICV